LDSKGIFMTGVVITAATRTAIGSYGNGLAGVPPSDLGALAGAAAIDRAGIEPDQIDHVVFGNVIHTEPGDAYVAGGGDEGRRTPGGPRLEVVDPVTGALTDPFHSILMGVTAENLAELGLVTRCIGGGQGIAMLLGRE
jgi:acetyl-CoA C-acetyltransferase